ncbi:MAG: type II 3-dehydroquinate dehydratase [Corynebacterium sp.]|uniref:type II 3-dehydroquinate dehydratase n=1 Tax=Corynebacterium sp. TaxID=1720 RepID=UPI0026DEB102|nr:type II 3-dehydroquinate dehydratase [Corynebacterium sp.]MDO5670243.1 type II 3-dehydroquinate dehydratase [Corynebacterium sp.]
MDMNPQNSNQKLRIAVLDGPNIANIGNEPDHRYHTLHDWEELRDLVARVADTLDLDVTHIATNYEGKLLEWLHANSQSFDGIVINPGSLTSYSEGLRHALEETRKPFVEVHFFNTVKHFARVSPHIRLESRITASATGVVSGFGQHSYTAALFGLTSWLRDQAGGEG